MQYQFWVMVATTAIWINKILVQSVPDGDSGLQEM
jgi:hypothetical protein